jgi:hypothetical protein
MIQYLGDNMGGGAKAVDPDSPPITGHFQRSVSDETGA